MLACTEKSANSPGHLIEHITRRHFVSVQVGQVDLGSATALRRHCAPAVGATRVDALHCGDQSHLKAHLQDPAVTEVVVIEEPFPAVPSEIGELDTDTDHPRS